MSKRTTNELRASKSRNEVFAEIGAAAVLAGLFCEVVLAAVFRDPKKPFFEDWGPVIADFLVAAGVAAEVWFGRRALGDADELIEDAENMAALALLTGNNSAAEASNANLRAAQAEVKAAEANERAAMLVKEAAEARVETERIRATISWRYLSEKQLTGLLDALTPNGGLIVIQFEESDPDSQSFARQLAAAFRLANWTVSLTMIRLAELRHGVIVEYDDRYPAMKRGADEIAVAMTAAAIGFVVARLPMLISSTLLSKEGMVVSSSPSRLYVGPKIPPGR
jgi:hypothetical protein